MREHLVDQRNGTDSSHLTEIEERNAMLQVLDKILDAAYGETNMTDPQTFKEYVKALHACGAVPEKEQGPMLALIKWGIDASRLAGAPVREPFEMVAIRLAILSDSRGWVTSTFAGGRAIDVLRKAETDKDKVSV